MLRKLLIIPMVISLLTACATPEVVEKKKITDQHLSCSGLEKEIKDCEDFRDKAMKEKGATGTNVAAAMLFWPGLFATYANANEAIQAADARKEHLIGIHQSKSCKAAPTR